MIALSAIALNKAKYLCVALTDHQMHLVTTMKASGGLYHQ